MVKPKSNLDEAIFNITNAIREEDSKLRTLAESNDYIGIADISNLVASLMNEQARLNSANSASKLNSTCTTTSCNDSTSIDPKIVRRIEVRMYTYCNHV